MPEHDFDDLFEQRLANRLRDYAEQGVRPYDAMHIAHAAATGAGTRPAAIQERGGLPTWLRVMVTAALLIVMLVAVAFVGGFIRLPTGLVEPSGSPSGTFTATSPDPSASLQTPGSPLPTRGVDGTPGPIATPDPSATAGPQTTPSVPPTVGPTTLPTVEPTVAPTLPPTLEPTLPPLPTAAPASAPLIAVEAGDTHACGIRFDRTIACWGANEFGELGNGTITAGWTWPAVTVSGIDDAVAVSAGNRFTCAVRAGGSVWCWGEGGAGQLGNDEQNDSATPVQVSGISDAIDVTTGAAFACALNSDLTVACWGLNSLGQLGNGTVTQNTGNPTPVDVEISDATTITSGWNHTCARRTDFSVWCWGGNGDGATGYGQIGDGTLENRPSPVAVAGLDNVSDLDAGGWTTCAALLDRSVWCWGYGERGGLGNGTTANSSVPVQVSGLSDADVVAVGGWHACALRSSGQIACWGANSDGGTGYGQLGSGDREDHSLPVPVVGIDDALHVSAAWISTCAIRQGGAVWCWGPGGGSEDPWQIPVPPTGLINQPVGHARRTQLERGA